LSVKVGLGSARVRPMRREFGLRSYLSEPAFSVTVTTQRRHPQTMPPRFSSEPKFFPMKKKQSHVVARKRTTRRKVSDFPLPDPIELVQLAAILWPNAPNATDALKIALKWYFDAVLLCVNMPPLTSTRLSNRSKKTKNRRNNTE